MAPTQVVNEGAAARIDPSTDPRIVVAGCGGAGCNVTREVYEKNLPGVETVAVNTDPGALERTVADVRILLAQGVSVDGDPVLAGYAAEACRDLLKAATAVDIVFLVSGLGGGTGTGASPVLAQAAKEAGAHTVAIVILPFEAEGREERARQGLEQLKAVCDSVVILDNNALERLGETLSLHQGFSFVNQVVLAIIEGVLEHLSSSVLTTLVEEVEAVAREMMEGPVELPVEVATPVIEAASQFQPVAFDATGFIGYR